MISNMNSEGEFDLRGLSTDTKPTGERVPNGSAFVEMDTGKVYMYDAANAQWCEL